MDIETRTQQILAGENAWREQAALDRIENLRQQIGSQPRPLPIVHRFGYSYLDRDIPLRDLYEDLDSAVRNHRARTWQADELEARQQATREAHEVLLAAHRRDYDARQGAADGMAAGR